MNRRLLAVLWMLGSLFLATALYRAWSHAPAYASNPEYDAEERVEWWTRSSACFQTTHVPLAICDPAGKPYPIEDFSLADDRGHALLAEIAGAVRSHPADRLTLTRINILIDVVGVVFLAFVLYGAGFQLSGVLFLWAGAYYAVPGPVPGPDVYSAHLGIFALVSAFVVGLIVVDPAKRPIMKGVWGCAALGFVGATLLRQPIGLIGFLSSLLILAWKAWQDPERNANIVFYTAVLTFLFLASQMGHIVIAVRNLFYSLPPAQHIASHGIWQTLFHGLGTEPNPWNISWRDDYGLALVHSIDPKAGYLTPAYQKVLRTLYVSILWRDPLAVFVVYSIKLEKAILFPFRLWGMNIYIPMLLALGALVTWRKPFQEKTCRPLLHVIAGLLLMLGLFLLQGVLGIPWGIHLYPVKLIVVLILICSVEITARLSPLWRT